MEIKKQKWGVLSDGTKVHLYTVSNGNMSFSCTDYGCTITSIVINGKNGKKTDVVLGYSTLDGFINGNLFFGALVGRFANRIGKAAFTIGKTEYKLDKMTDQTHFMAATKAGTKKCGRLRQSKKKTSMELLLKELRRTENRAFLETAM